jgi:hypothetical protein
MTMMISFTMIKSSCDNNDIDDDHRATNRTNRTNKFCNRSNIDVVIIKIISRMFQMTKYKYNNNITSVTSANK